LLAASELGGKRDSPIFVDTKVGTVPPQLQSLNLEFSSESDFAELNAQPSQTAEFRKPQWHNRKKRESLRRLPIFLTTLPRIPCGTASPSGT
jgi:hypothetical protein